MVEIPPIGLPLYPIAQRPLMQRSVNLPPDPTLPNIPIRLIECSLCGAGVLDWNRHEEYHRHELMAQDQTRQTLTQVSNAFTVLVSKLRTKPSQQRRKSNG